MLHLYHLEHIMCFAHAKMRSWFNELCAWQRCIASDYITTFLICQTNLYKMYGNSNTSFQVTNFIKFIDVVPNISCRIVWNLVTNFNDATKHLTFYIMGQSHMVHYVDLLTNLHSPITHGEVEATIIVVKA